MKRSAQNESYAGMVIIMKRLCTLLLISLICLCMLAGVGAAAADTAVASPAEHTAAPSGTAPAAPSGTAPAAASGTAPEAVEMTPAITNRPGAASPAGPSLDPQAPAFEVDDEETGRNSSTGIFFAVAFFGICLILVVEGIVSYIVKAKKRRDDKFR